MVDPVSARRGQFVLPIVPLLPPDPNPALPSLGERAVYPYTRAYRFGSEPVEREMEALVLKNDLLDLQVVPALAGRLWGTCSSTCAVSGPPRPAPALASPWILTRPACFKPTSGAS